MPGRRVRGVDAGVRADEAVARAADEHAALGAHDLGGLVEHDLDVARVLAVLGGELARALARARRRRARRRAPRPWRRPCARRRARRRRADVRPRSSAREVVAGPHLGQPGERAAVITRAERRGGPRRRGAAARRRRGRRPCRRRARATATSSTAHATPAAARQRARGARGCRGPNAGAIASGGVSSSAFVPGAVAVGDDDDAGAGCAVEQRVDLGGGRAAGSRRGRAGRAAAPQLDARGAMPSSAAALWPARVALVDDLARRAARRAPRRPARR